jgi:hypothetical protein
MSGFQFSQDPAIAEKQALKSMKKKERKINLILFGMFFVGAPSSSIVAAIDQSIHDFQTFLPVAEWLKGNGRPQVAQYLEKTLRGLYIGRGSVPQLQAMHYRQQGIDQPYNHPHVLQNNNPWTQAITDSTKYAQDGAYQASEKWDRMIRGQD